VDILMRFLPKLLLSLILAITFSAHATGLIIVANTDDSDMTLEKRQVRDIFMGNNSNINLQPIALAPNSDARFVFNTKIVGLTESRVQSYWAQMRFSGRKKPPQEFASIQALLNFVKNNKGAVTYVPSQTDIPDGLTVIYQIE
jgi:ABC-type phosphate transport system substrate-binding protein